VHTPVTCDDGNPCTVDSCDSATGCVNAPDACDDGDACTVDFCGPSNCCVANGGLGCDNPECEATVCATDPFCCDTEWDSICADEAIALCGLCDIIGCMNPPVDCDDGDACTTDSCDPATGCMHTPVDCGDNDECTVDVCGPSNCCGAHGGVGCNDSACQDVVCAIDPFCCDTEWDSICADEAIELCGACGGVCTHTPVDCDDGDACTDDSCDPAAGCVNAPVNCDDDDFCTEDSCDPATGGCMNTPVDCNDGDFCTDDSCDPATGCMHTPVDCDDGDACTDESCDPATGCVYTPIRCGDDNSCTFDNCDPDTGCVHTPIDCNDMNACTVDDCAPGLSNCCVPHGGPGCDETGCQATVCAADPFCCDTEWDSICAGEATDLCGDLCRTNCCVPNGGPGCNDPECQAAVCAADSFCCDVEWDDICAGEALGLCPDLCGGGTGVCTYTPVDCDDGDVCTTNSCDPATGCMNTPVDCDDGDACTDDSCFAGVGSSDCCVPHDGPGCDDGACQAAVCRIDPACCEGDGQWGPACAESAASLCADLCSIAECAHPPVVCDDGNACTDDSCDPATGCVYTPIRCGDGDACTDDSCDPATGCVHTPVDCDDMDACTVDGCAPGSSNCCEANGGLGCDDRACEAAVCAADAFCCETEWDGICAGEALNLCGDLCGSTCCVSSGGLGCDDPDCQAAVCAADPFCCDVEWDGVCAGEALDLCADLCGAGAVGCTHTPVDCDDGDACTDDSCDPATGGCVNTPVDCDDMDVCTVDTCNSATATACTQECCNFHLGPGCSDPACEALVCAAEPLCCADGFDWDQACTMLAADMCGLAQPSDCCGFIGPGAVCSDPACVDVVCASDPFCCDTSWDTLCGIEAQELCGGLCCCGGGTGGGCTHTPVDCDDGNACTADSCDPAAGCVSTFIDGCVDLDITPGSCPNPFRPGIISVLTMSLTGSAEFDVSLIDQNSLVLSRADKVGDDLAPRLGVITIGDLATPFGGPLCSCHTLTADGWNDLNMSFKNAAVTAAFRLNNLSPGQDVVLELSGTFVDGTPFIASDCIRLQGVFGTATTTP
jgi:hypothetical protein